MGIDREKLIREARRHLSLADDTARINTALLICHLREQAQKYKENILPLYPNDSYLVATQNHIDFDEAKYEFLESLWDVIYQHFTDNGDV